MIEQKQAIKDMIDFVAEFELWLEGEVKESQSNEWNIKIGAESIISETLIDVLDNYRRCKQRIEYHDE